MPSSIIRGRYLLSTVNEQGVAKIFRDGALFQRDGEIIDIGDYQSIKNQYVADEEIGSKNHVVLPGLVNAHNHGRGISYVRKGVADDNLEPWLINLMGQKPIDTYLDILYSVTRLIESGVTTVLHSHHPRDLNYETEVTAILKVYQDAGVRVAFALGIQDQNNLVYQDDTEFVNSIPPYLSEQVNGFLDKIRLSEENYFDIFDKLQKKYQEQAVPMVRILHGPIGSPWCSDRLLKRIKISADDYHAGIHTHIDETIYQRKYSLKEFGKTATEHFEDLGLLGPLVSFAHCVWVTENDIKLLAQNGVSVCHNPSSNLRLGSGIAPINLMRKMGVNVTLGTDSLSMNDDEDMLQDMRLCYYLHRGTGLNPEISSPEQLLRMATINGAKATLFEDHIGSLEKGKRADAILVKFPDIFEQFVNTESEFLYLLVGGIKANHVDTVIADGEILLKDGKHMKINKNEIEAALIESMDSASRSSDIANKNLAKELQPHIINFYRNQSEED